MVRSPLRARLQVFFVCALLGSPLTAACLAGETPYIQHLLARFAIGNLGQCGRAPRPTPFGQDGRREKTERGVSYIARTTATVSDIPELDTDRNPILNFSPDLNYTGLFTGYGHRCGISNELCDTVRDREQRALGGSFGGRVRDWTPTSAVRALARTAIF